MATAHAMAAAEHELRVRADYGATYSELLENLDEQDRRLGRGGFSDDQEEELQLYCWAFPKFESGLPFGTTRVGGVFEDYIGG